MKKILFVEDNQEFAMSCIEKLLDNGYEIEYADNAEKAKQIMAEKKFDLFILDLMLPPTYKIEGLDLYRFIKENNDSPTIFMSSKSFKTTDIVAEAMRLGAKDFIDKDNSVFHDKLIAAVKQSFVKKKPDNQNNSNSSLIIISIYAVLFLLLISVLTLVSFLITKIGLPFLQTFLVISTVTISILIIIISSQLMNEAKIKEETWLNILKSRIVNFPSILLEKLLKK